MYIKTEDIWAICDEFGFYYHPDCYGEENATQDEILSQDDVEKMWEEGRLYCDKCKRPIDGEDWGAEYDAKQEEEKEKAAERLAKNKLVIEVVHVNNKGERIEPTEEERKEDKKIEGREEKD